MRAEAFDICVYRCSRHPDVLRRPPGTSHALPLEKPGLVNSLLLDFLADPQPPKYLPMGDLNA
jgi:hypothetical protein